MNLELAAAFIEQHRNIPIRTNILDDIVVHLIIPTPDIEVDSVGVNVVNVVKSQFCTTPVRSGRVNGPSIP